MATDWEWRMEVAQLKEELRVTCVFGSCPFDMGGCYEGVVERKRE